MKIPLIILIIGAFLITSIGPLPVYAQLTLPTPGVRVSLSPPENPPVLKGVTVDLKNPFHFDFILDKGDSDVGAPVQEEAQRLIKYFLASITTPEQDLWVNLSPYEKNRIIPKSFGLTDMGRDLLAEDYILKQITASLIYPEDEFGKKFWKRVYEEAAKKYGTASIPVNTFNKVWIVPDHAKVYEHGNTAFVVKAKLKVMLEQDYLALEKNTNSVIARSEATKQSNDLPVGQAGIASLLPPTAGSARNDTSTLGSQIVRELVIPALETEVNEGKNFAALRQVYYSLILAVWFKKRMKESLLGRKYMDQNKVTGLQYENSVIARSPKGATKQSNEIASLPTVARNDTNDVEAIYRRYLAAFKKGVYNYIKEEPDPVTQQVIPRKYFSGGFSVPGDFAMHNVDYAQTIQPDEAVTIGDAAEVTVDLANSDQSKANIDVLSDISRRFENGEVVDFTDHITGLTYSIIKTWFSLPRQFYVYHGTVTNKKLSIEGANNETMGDGLYLSTKYSAQKYAQMRSGGDYGKPVVEKYFLDSLRFYFLNPDATLTPNVEEAWRKYLNEKVLPGMNPGGMRRTILIKENSGPLGKKWLRDLQYVVTKEFSEFMMSQDYDGIVHIEREGRAEDHLSIVVFDRVRPKLISTTIGEIGNSAQASPAAPDQAMKVEFQVQRVSDANPLEENEVFRLPPTGVPSRQIVERSQQPGSISYAIRDKEYKGLLGYIVAVPEVTKIEHGNPQNLFIFAVSVTKFEGLFLSLISKVREEAKRKGFRKVSAMLGQEGIKSGVYRLLATGGIVRRFIADLQEFRAIEFNIGRDLSQKRARQEEVDKQINLLNQEDLRSRLEKLKELIKKYPNCLIDIEIPITEDSAQASQAPDQAMKVKPVSFQTAFGSVYKVLIPNLPLFESRRWLSTQRTKTPHTGHLRDDVGLKQPSRVTFFVSSQEDFQRIVQHATLQGMQPLLYIEVKDGKIILTLATHSNGKWGKFGEEIFVSTTPKEGYFPLELFGKILISKERNKMIFADWHPGNVISSINDTIQASQAPDQAMKAEDIDFAQQIQPDEAQMSDGAMVTVNFGNNAADQAMTTEKIATRMINWPNIKGGKIVISVRHVPFGKNDPRVILELIMTIPGLEEEYPKDYFQHGAGTVYAEYDLKKKRGKITDVIIRNGIHSDIRDLGLGNLLFETALEALEGEGISNVSIERVSGAAEGYNLSIPMIRIANRYGFSPVMDVAKTLRKYALEDGVKVQRTYDIKSQPFYTISLGTDIRGVATGSPYSDTNFISVVLLDGNKNIIDREDEYGIVPRGTFEQKILNGDGGAIFDDLIENRYLGGKIIGQTDGYGYVKSNIGPIKDYLEKKYPNINFDDLLAVLQQSQHKKDISFIISKIERGEALIGNVDYVSQNSLYQRLFKKGQLILQRVKNKLIKSLEKRSSAQASPAAPDQAMNTLTIDNKVVNLGTDEQMAKIVVRLFETYYSNARPSLKRGLIETLKKDYSNWVARLAQLRSEMYWKIRGANYTDPGYDNFYNSLLTNHPPGLNVETDTDWLYRGNFKGDNRKLKFRGSLNVAPNARSIAALDRLFLSRNSDGKFRISGNYKIGHPGGPQDSRKRHDAVTFYSEEYPSQEVLSELSKIVANDYRGEGLVGKKISKGFAMSEVGIIKSAYVKKLHEQLIAQKSVLQSLLVANKNSEYQMSEGQFYALRAVFRFIGINLAYDQEKGFALLPLRFTDVKFAGKSSRNFIIKSLGYIRPVKFKFQSTSSLLGKLYISPVAVGPSSYPFSRLQVGESFTYEMGMVKFTVERNSAEGFRLINDSLPKVEVQFIDADQAMKARKTTPVSTEQKIMDIDPILELSQMIRNPADIDRLVEPSLRKAVKIFFDKNILTTKSSANRDDLRQGYAYINLDWKTLSEQNREIVQQNDGIKMGDIIQLRIPFIGQQPTVESVEQQAAALADLFQEQPMTWAVKYALPGVNRKEAEALASDFGNYYDPESRKIYYSKILFEKEKASRVAAIAPGGIDLTANRMKVEVEKDKAQISQVMDLKALENIEINGLYIKDVEIVPLENLSEILGLK